MECSFGIDLGTAYTRLAMFDGNTRTLVCAMPSYVAFTDSGILIGEDARIQALDNPANTIFDVLRLIGWRHSDPSVLNDKRLWPFKVRASPDDGLLVNVRCKGKMLQFTPVEICSMILIQIKQNAEKTLTATITDAVITVPVCFNFGQRKAINEAGMIAGLNFVQIISAPAASALFHGMERFYNLFTKASKSENYIIRGQSQEHNMVIFDLGAGTLDVAVVTIKDYVCKVQGTAGSIHLGGSNIDNNIFDHFVNCLKKSGQKDVSNIQTAMSKLKMICEKAKILFSSGKMPAQMITPIYDDVNLDSSISEAKFHVLNKDLLSKCINIVKKCLIDASMGIGAVNEVILAGGSTKIPWLQSNISSFFNGKALTISQNLEATNAYGAAMQAFYLGTWMNGSFRSFSLLDVTPSSVGVELARGETSVFVPKNTTIPNKITMPLHFGNPNKTKMIFNIYEGEGTQTCQNNFLGKFDLLATHFAPTGRDIDMCFEVHRNGALTVMAEEIFSGIRNGITITPIEIENSKKRVWEALFHKECETSTTKASMTKSLTRSSTSGKWDQPMERGLLRKLLSMDKERSEKVIGQSSRQYIEPEEYAIGIDFGTTYSSVAVWRRNGVQIIENEYGSRLTCSAVAFTDTGRLIGDAVHKEQVTTNPANTIPNIKRLIGRCYLDQSVQNDNKFLPFNVLCDDKNRLMVSVQYKNEEKHFAFEEIAAMILSKMKEIAIAHLNSEVKNAVISIPASFSDSQRRAIKDAGVVAGLNVMQLLNEPTATAIAYFLQKSSGQSTTEKTLLIFDVGGGILDVSIVTMKEGSIKVLAVAGDANLGGEDFDNNMVSYFIEKFMKEKRRDISNNPRPLRRLRAACEKAKILLSTTVQAVLEIDALDDGVDFHSAITRRTFEEINKDLFKRCIGYVKRCLEDAEIDRSCIDDVVLVGGSTRIPKMQQLLQEFFNGKELCTSMNANEAVVYGAAVQAAILSGMETREKFNISQFQDVTAHSLGMEHKYGATKNLIFPKHTPIPETKELIFTNCIDKSSSFSIQVQECEFPSTMVFTLSGIQPKRRGNSKVNVYFQVDDNGILNLTAKDTRAREEEIEIKKENGGLTTEDIKKMVEAAARYKVEDEEQKKRAAALNCLQSLAYEMKAVDNDGGVSGSSKKLVETAANEAITWLETNYDASIDEITLWKKHLESIKSRIIYLGTIAIIQ